MMILASGSPRRKELLKQLGVAFEVKVAAIDEKIDGKLSPSENVIQLARQKAFAVQKNNLKDIVIACDTVVVKENKILGKPKDKAHARKMLLELCDGWHEVYTGVCVLKGENEKTFAEKTKVHMKKIEIEEIEEYIQSEEPLDKAGSYAIQGKASRWIDRIEGDYFNVVGVPVSHLYEVLKNLEK